MIWNYIRDFIVEFITGGTLSSGDYTESAFFGFSGGNGSDYGAFSGNELYYNIGLTDGEANMTICASDWLATTLTIICMCLIVAFAIWLVIWVFKAVAHAFLLRR